MEGRLITLAVGLAVIFSAGCGGQKPADDVPPHAAPLPVAGMAGQQVTVYPLTLLAAEASLDWAAHFQPRREALDRADSLIATLLTERAPEINWVLPPELRRAAGRAPGLLADPDHIATAVLRAGDTKRVPDPLRSQMRNLTGAAGDRYALVPASLVFVPGGHGAGRAELTVAITDVRTGLIQWRTTTWAEGSDPWSALWNALTELIPDLP